MKYATREKIGNGLLVIGFILIVLIFHTTADAQVVLTIGPGTIDSTTCYVYTDGSVICQ